MPSSSQFLISVVRNYKIQAFYLSLIFAKLFWTLLVFVFAFRLTCHHIFVICLNRWK